MSELADAADSPNQQEPTGITSSMLMAGILASGGMTGLGIVILAAVGGANSSTATNTLMLIMTPIVTGLMAMLVSKLSAMHKQFNSRMDELLVSVASRSHAEGIAEERAAGAVRAADAALATAVVAAEKAVTDTAAAEARSPAAEGSEKEIRT